MGRLKKTTEQWLLDFKKVHQDRYDYTKSIFLRSEDKIEIICSKHGPFFQKAFNHLNGCGCPKCITDKFWNETKLRKEIINHYGDKYNLKNFSVGKNYEKMELFCNCCNTSFLISRETLTRFPKILCKNCKKLNVAKCLDIANTKHKNFYDYSKFVFNDVMEKSIIICPIHGEFLQQVSSHIYEGKGCPKCAKERTLFKTKSLNQNINDLNNTHNNGLKVYDYSLIKEGTKAFDKVQIICSIHGEFSQILNNHKNGAGCPKCNSKGGKWQFEIVNFLKNEGIENILEYNRNTISNELDIYLPDHNLAIELNGNIFHSYGKTFPNNYMDLRKNIKTHQMKSFECFEKNINLLQILDLDWNNPKKKEIWKSVIKTKLNKDIYKVHARKLQVIDLNTHCDFINTFLEDNHLQGSCQASIKLGLQDPKTGIVYSIMTFGKSRFNKNIEYELLRFCNAKFHSVRGAASKLLKAFERAYKPRSLVSYANRDWSQGNLYKVIGFEYIHTSEPNYFYIKQNQIISRIQAQKHKLKDFLESRNEIFNENLSERDNMINNGYRIYYNSGNSVYYKFYNK